MKDQPRDRSTDPATLLILPRFGSLEIRELIGSIPFRLTGAGAGGRGRSCSVFKLASGLRESCQREMRFCSWAPVLLRGRSYSVVLGAPRFWDHPYAVALEWCTDPHPLPAGPSSIKRTLSDPRAATHPCFGDN